MKPIIRDLRVLEREVENAVECRGYVGAQVFKGVGKEASGPAPLLGLRASRAL